MSSTVETTIPTPDDWHVHLRDDHVLAAVVPYMSRVFRYALVMPNLSTPIVTLAQAESYRKRVLDAAGGDAQPDFQPLMTLYFNDQMAADDLVSGHELGLLHGAKFYPAGTTTNSDAGGESLLDFRNVLETMAANHIPLMVHAESTDPTVDIFDREAAFLERQLAPVCAELPELRVTVEHLSTAAGVDFVRSHSNVGGSITPHHLTCVRSDILASGLKADLYCKPVLNSAADRDALIAAAVSGEAKFFMGTDSAPHPQSDKQGATIKPGIFNAPHAIEVVAEVFAQAGRLDRLGSFVSINGAAHYGLGPSNGWLHLRRGDQDKPISPDSLVTTDGQVIHTFGTELARNWTLRPAVGEKQ